MIKKAMIIMYLILFLFTLGRHPINILSINNSDLTFNEWTTIVELYGENIHGEFIDRYISINGINITVSGYTVNINNTWNSSVGRIMEFSAIWTQQVEGEIAYNLLPIPEEIYYKFKSDSKKELIFASDYNGTHFKEAIIVGIASAHPARKVAFISPMDRNRTYAGIGPYIIIYEYNRSVITANSTDSIHNPSFAIFQAVRYLQSCYICPDTSPQLHLSFRAFPNHLWYLATPIRYNS